MSDPSYLPDDVLQEVGKVTKALTSHHNDVPACYSGTCGCEALTRERILGVARVAFIQGRGRRNQPRRGAV